MGPVRGAWERSSGAGGRGPVPATEKPPGGVPQARPQALPRSGEAIWKNFPQLCGFKKLPWSWERRSSRDWLNVVFRMVVRGECIGDVVEDAAV